MKQNSKTSQSKSRCEVVWLLIIFQEKTNKYAHIYIFFPFALILQNQRAFAFLYERFCTNKMVFIEVESIQTLYNAL